MIHSLRVLALAATVASALALGACEVSIGDKAIDRDELEIESSRTLQKETGQRPASIECPEDLKAEVDATETCELVDRQGNRYDMKVTVTAVDDDGKASFNIEVRRIKRAGDAPNPS